MARRYAVDSVMAGEPGPGTFGFTTEDEGKAIVEYRKILAETCNAAYTSGRITSDESGDAVANAQSVMIAMLLDMTPGMRISQTVAGIHHFIEFIGETGPVEVEEVEDPLVKAVRECDIDTAKSIMDERDKLPRADVNLDWQSLAAREVKAEGITRMIEWTRQNYRKLPDEMSAHAQGERNGLIYGILLAAGVPYAVAGEMRPSKVWQNTHETIRLVVMDPNLDATETAYWLVDQPMPESAPETQPDFAEQIRPESEAADDETKVVPDPWFGVRHLEA